VSAALYRADREIARGGMGRIVAAEDQRLGRPVALKELLDPAAEMLGRFQREALITARLQHPGIVPVYEAGRWPSGAPFFAMKLVAGRPLDRVIAEAKVLVDRLALLPQIAAATDAIAYAHSQRVIHRDLKPANILIGDFGETVVIDWGLAKHLDDAEPDDPNATRVLRAQKPAKESRPGEHASTLTIAGAVMGTPAYMAPEQARGEPLDQRADVFALGAMLYHLLAGVPPYNARTATDVIAAAALGKVIPLADRELGAPVDLVAIVHRAMSPLPIDRYADAGELATELRRFLTGQLVSAHRYTAAQRVSRFVHKHRAAVTISVLAAIGFAAGGTFAVRRIVHERDVADQERQIADTRREAAEHLIDKMLTDVKSRLQQIGRLDLLASLGSEIRNYYDTLAKIPNGMPADDIDRMAMAIDLIGFAERDSGKLDQALKTWTDARQTLARTAAGVPAADSVLKRRMIARFDFEIGTVHQQRGKLDLAVQAFTLAKREYAALLDELPADRLVLLGAAEIGDRLGDLLRNDGKIGEALDAFTEAKGYRERAASSSGGRPHEEVLALSTSHLKLGSVYQVRGESAKALDEYRVALKLRETLLAGRRDDVELQNRVLEVQFTLGDLQRQVGDPNGAIETYRKALPVMEALTRRDPANTTWLRLRGNLESDYGFTLLDRGEYRAALEKLESAIETQRALVGLDPKSAVWQGDLSRASMRAGDAQLSLGEIDRGMVQLQLALEIRRELVANEPKSAPYRRSVAWSYTKLATAYAAKNDPRQEIAALEQALDLRDKLVQEAPFQGSFRNELASTQTTLGKLLAATDPTRSKQLIAAGLASCRDLVKSDPINNEFRETFTLALLAQADAARINRDGKTREDALAEALTVARSGADAARDNVRWAGYLADVQAGIAELAASRGDPLAAALAWRAVRDLLEPLAKAGRLSVQRTALLARARAG
jgi:serine/threonine protein kinase/lipopolysaccharide biosynthesis regulator YciM